MLCLLTNDDGIYAPGLAALAREMKRLGEVRVVAPATEQSGVGHSITYLRPLIVKEIFDGEQPWGWAVEGSPADCVKLGIRELCPRTPDLVVSGINSGLNAGINVLYSGTVAAAIEGAFYGITSVAVSLQFEEHGHYEQAARLAREIIEQLVARKAPSTRLFNLNIPVAALRQKPQVVCVPMNVIRSGDGYEKRADPWGRSYYWLKGGPPPQAAEHETDMSALAKGMVTITPLDYNLTLQTALAEMESWQFDLPNLSAPAVDGEAAAGPDLKRSEA